MDRRNRYILEGRWSGYNTGPSLVHSEIIIQKKRQLRLRGLQRIWFTDGTYLALNLRPLKPRERARQIHRYCDLIRICEVHPGRDIWVKDLQQIEE